MRLFVGIELEPHVRSAISELIATLRANTARRAPRARVSWVPADNLHITIRFIGHADEQKAAAIGLALADPIDVAPFTLTIGRVGAFPPKGPPRVIWMDVLDGREQLCGIERVVTARLQGLGIEPEDRPYSPHVTLARVRESGGLKTRDLPLDLADVVAGTTPVDAITLFESRLSPKGPTYIALQKVRLKPDTTN